MGITLNRRGAVVGAWTVGLTLLASCGGGEPGPDAQPQAMRRALDAAAASEGIDATALFGWAERSFPDLFPKGPQNQVADYDGKTYTFRYYPATQSYLGVTGDQIAGLGPFTGGVLQGFGKLGDWSCQVLGQVCISGVAASGQALAGAKVEAKCSGPTAIVSASTLAAADGSYSLAVSGASLPCILRATGGDGTAVHSVVLGSGNGNKSTAHITPLTDMVVAYFTGFAPTTAYAAVTPAAMSFYAQAADQLKAASLSVPVILKKAGVDFTNVGDAFTSALLPGSDGNAHGQALARLASKMSGSLTQAVLSETLLRSTPGAKSAGTPNLPAEMLLLPAAPNCAALRSGSYQAVFSDVDNKNARITIDAPAMKVTASDGSSFDLVADGKCHYKQPDGREFAVSDAGVMIGRARTNGFRAMVAFPVQDIAMSEIAGEWNSLDLEDNSRDGHGFIHSTNSTVAGDGKVSGLTWCGKDAGKLAADCTNFTGSKLPDIRFSVNPAGGFFLTNTTDNWVEQAFVYRSGSGDLMLAIGGHLGLSTKARPAAVPRPRTRSESWTLGVSTQYVANGPMTESINTITAVDTAAAITQRDNVINLGTGVTRPERIELDRFRAGYTHRIPEAVTASDGSAQTVGEFVALTLKGSGLTAAGILGSQQSYVLSLTKSSLP